MSLTFTNRMPTEFYTHDSPGLDAPGAEADGEGSLAELAVAPERRSKPIRLLRADTLQLLSDPTPIEQFNDLMTERIGYLSNTIFRWWKGGFGDSHGEDPALRETMQIFADVALENIPASFLVRVFSHLEKGGDGLWQSATSVIKGAEREDPGEGPYEKALEANEAEAIERYDTYLSVVDRAASDPTFRPLGFITTWRDEFETAASADHLPKELTRRATSWASAWVGLIIDEASQTLRSHVKLLKDHEKNEKARTDELAKFRASATGKKYLTIRESHFPEGLPKNRTKRFEILVKPEVAKWKSEKAKCVASNDLKTLLDSNKQLSELVGLDIRYKELTKPGTPPTWTPVTAKNPKWVFLPKTFFNSDGLTWRAVKGLKGTENKAIECFGSSIFLPTLPRSLSSPEVGTPAPRLLRVDPVTINLREGATVRRTVAGWEFNRPDEVTNEMTPVTIKGLRFENNSGKWCARFSYEKIVPPASDRVSALRKAVMNRVAPELSPGDLVCVFVLDATAKGGKENRTRVGWLRVIGITDKGPRVLENVPVHSTKSHTTGKPASHRGAGQTPWYNRTGTDAHSHKGKPNISKERRPGGVTHHGQTEGVTLAQLLERKKTLQRQVKLLRMVKDPEQADDATDWLEKRRTPIAHTLERLRVQFLTSNGHSRPALQMRIHQFTKQQARLTNLIDKLRRGEPITKTDYRPFQKEIFRLRANLREGKKSLRQTVAKEVVRQVHNVRIGKGSKLVGDFLQQQAAAPNSVTVLVTEYQKRKGQGPYKPRRTNHILSVFGPSEIHELVQQKCAFTTPEIPTVMVPGGAVKGEPQSEKDKGKARGELKARELAQRFLSPPVRSSSPQEAEKDDE